MLREADYICVAAPNVPCDRLIGAREFEAMKPAAVIINVGRGPVIVESELVKALQTGRIRGAALDVFDTEPLPAGHPLYSLDNVLMSPHWRRPRRGLARDGDGGVLRELHPLRRRPRTRQRGRQAGRILGRAAREV